MAVSDLEKRKRTNFQEKRYADARANIKQKPYGASWIVDTQNLKRVLQPIENRIVFTLKIVPEYSIEKYWI